MFGCGVAKFLAMSGKNFGMWGGKKYVGCGVTKIFGRAAKIFFTYELR